MYACILCDYTTNDPVVIRMHTILEHVNIETLEMSE